MKANAWWRRALRWLADSGLPEHSCEAFDFEPGLIAFRGEAYDSSVPFPIEVGDTVQIDLPELRDAVGSCRFAFYDLPPDDCALRENRAFEACIEWLRGCSCAPTGRPWECEMCTQAFHAHLDELIGRKTP